MEPGESALFFSNNVAWFFILTDALAVHGVPYVILATGQSNTRDAQPFVWTPESNAFVWNNAYIANSAVDGDVGTTFIPLPSTTVDFTNRMASEVARNNPNRRTYVVNVSFGGRTIDHWLPGASAPDVYANMKAIVEAALASLGLTKIDRFVFWQGESNANNAALWLDGVRTLIDRLFGETWFLRSTPIMLSALGSNAVTGLTTNDTFNGAVEAVVADDPDNRQLLYPGAFPIAYWSDNFHMTAEGYFLAGAAAARIAEHGGGRAPRVEMAACESLAVNGDHICSQVNGSNAVTGIAGATYVTDHWKTLPSGAVRTTGQRIIASGLPGFAYAHRLTVTTPDVAIAAGDCLLLDTRIEGLDWGRLGWGAAGAYPATFGFFVRSSVPGTYGFSITNGALASNWMTTFSINLANTWEYKTIFVPPDVAVGTWPVNETVGAIVSITLSAGSTFQGTINTWGAAYLLTTSEQTNFSGTNGATFDITGFFAIPLSYAPKPEEVRNLMRPGEVEIAKVRRQFYRVPNTATVGKFIASGFNGVAQGPRVFVDFPDPMITTPALIVSSVGHFAFRNNSNALQAAITSLTLTNATPESAEILGVTAANLDLGAGTALYANNAAATMDFVARL
jgi:hypothetical protein